VTNQRANGFRLMIWSHRDYGCACFYTHWWKTML